MQSTALTNISPSFTTYSSSNLADVAARVVREFRHENGTDYDDIFNFNDYDCDYDYHNTDEKLKDENNCTNHDDTNDIHDDDEFEFAVVCTDVNSSSISVDISPQYPLFDRSLLLDVDPDLNTDACKPSSMAVRIPLKKLFSEDRDFGSSSSSEADDLDGIAPGTYCVWKPKTQSPERCKKSNSTGNSSRRWKFRDILYRSNSDGKETPFFFFKPLIATKKMTNNEKVKADPANKAENRGERKQSYLPSGKTLVDAFSTVSRSNRNLHPF
ncbi:hypothetical protein QVD17_10732 [Tagetes erecta]|uniref:Uncharacterized protein n=1 Tax=Tagetes erecta TaxID=13708 RepID=A0AAD8NZT2_TARER|nr:hypothetical protein QVD17_10732 [Tagetes erecta]